LISAIFTNIFAGRTKLLQQARHALAGSLAALASLAVGCGIPVTRQPPAPCPVPPVPICTPTRSTLVTLDTTRPEPGKFYHHISILPEGMNSPSDDNAITFIPDKNGKLFALVSSDRRISVDEPAHTVQRMFSAPFIHTTKYGQVVSVHEEASPIPCGAGCWSPADKKFYFTAKAENSDPDDFDLYSAQIEFEGQTPHLTHVDTLDGTNLKNYFDGQPTITPDGLTIYFTSDRHGGEGGTDIWYSTRSNILDTKWSAPKSLPPPFNTPCDEISPSLSHDGKLLFFSSNGHATVGGYDLFKCKAEALSTSTTPLWSPPENLGAPINTPYDEVFPYSLNDSAFFFTSNQPAQIGGRNIYTLTRTFLPLRPNDRVIADAQTSVASLDSVQKRDSIFKSLANVPVTINGHVDQHAKDSTELIVTDASTKEELANRKITPSGDFKLLLSRGKQYDVSVKNENSFYDQKHLDLRTSIDTMLVMQFALPDTLVLRINFPFDDYLHPYEFIIGDSGEQMNVTWEHSLDMIAQSATLSKKHLKELVLIGHTDSLGTDAYNEQLGTRRSTFVKAQLVARGVPASMIRIDTRGRTVPIDRRPTESADIFRLRSRRVEFVKVFKQ
jgi:hypothetical protein